MADTSGVRRVRAQLPGAWHAEAKLGVARDIVANRHAMTLHARPDTLDRDINNFFHRHRGDQTMRIPSYSGAAMPPRMNPDNYTGSAQYRRRDHDSPRPMWRNSSLMCGSGCLRCRLTNERKH